MNPDDYVDDAIEHDKHDNADYASFDDIRDLERVQEDVAKALSIIAEKLGLTIPHVWKYGCCDGPIMFHIDRKSLSSFVEAAEQIEREGKTVLIVNSY